jgi:hypothetical protein
MKYFLARKYASPSKGSTPPPFTGTVRTKIFTRKNEIFRKLWLPEILGSLWADVGEELHHDSSDLCGTNFYI